MANTSSVTVARTSTDCGLVTVAALSSVDALGLLGSATSGLSVDEAAIRLRRDGPNAVRDHRARAWGVFVRQVRSPLVALLAATAVVSFFLSERTDAVVIAVILAASIGLGFVNEYRAEKTAQALHQRIRHRATVIRDAAPLVVDVSEIARGDIVRLETGSVVPADVRLLQTADLQCDESILTGEATPVSKSAAAVPAGAPVSDLRSCAFMGTVVSAGTGTGVVVATGGRTEFGRIAMGLGTTAPETEFQVGLRKFSMLLMQVAGVLTTLILITNIALHRKLIDAVLFSLAIAVGITPQLLPAVVSMSLASGSRKLARLRVLVKRLVCIEDLGDLDILITDKTGTLTEGRISLRAATGVGGTSDDDALLLGLLAADVDVRDGSAIGGNALDIALYNGASSVVSRSGAYRRMSEIPFDHNRQMSSAVVATPGGGKLLICKGAPESVLARCSGEPSAEVRRTLDGFFKSGARVIAVATRLVDLERPANPADERDLKLVGILVFRDPAKPDAASSLRKLADLGVSVKVATGDNPLVAETLWSELGQPAGKTLRGVDIDALDDASLLEAAESAVIFARVTPEQKARIVRLLRSRGRAVGFLGDGVNDALALHAADVGISVDTAIDVAKDAADVILLEKSLAVLADGVREGRRIFANTIKYVLMGTSSNFGNMFSAAGASAVLHFLPMLPSQILLNNLLYDTSQLAIPTDNVDAEQLARPAHWDIHFIRRFMLFFGPISSLFDFVTFAVMLGVFHAGPDLFRTGWFVESLSTQALVIFAVRTRRVPFFRSRPSVPLLCGAVAVSAIGALLPYTPLAHPLGFIPLPPAFFGVLVGLVAAYLVLIELGKRLFYADAQHTEPLRRRGRSHRLERRASRFNAAATPTTR